MKGLKANSSDSQIYQYFFREKLLCVQPNLLNLMSSKSSTIFALKLSHLKQCPLTPGLQINWYWVEITKCILVITQLAFFF